MEKENPPKLNFLFALLPDQWSLGVKWEEMIGKGIKGCKRI
jgi:hypothetical protein